MIFRITFYCIVQVRPGADDAQAGCDAASVDEYSDSSDEANRGQAQAQANTAIIPKNLIA